MHRHARSTVLSALTVLFGVLLVASDAHALDGYQSRKHVFGGLALGGGYGALLGEGEVAEMGPGFHAQGIFGTGVNEWWTFGVEADWWVRSVSKSDANEYTFHHGSVGGVGNLFLTEGWFLDAGAGFAYGICSGRFQGGNCGWQELGLSAQAGFGFEFWFNGTVAGVANLDYTHHFYMHGTSFGNVSAVFGVRWY
jgi:hypothetical protein